jgi:glucokinase
LNTQAPPAPGGRTVADILVGIDLGGTNIKAGVVTTEGEILVQDRAKTLPEEGAESVLRRMADLACRVVEQAEANMDDVLAIGVGSPGPLSARNGVVIFTPNLNWKDVHVVDVLTGHLNKPIFLENDANSACWGEYWAGAGAEFDSMFILTLGTGVGGGIILGGELLRGATESGGHLGHVVVEPDGLPCGCEGYGCVEQYASATAVARTANDALEAGGYSRFLPSDGQLVTAQDVAEAAAKGCSLCDDIIREAARYLGIVIADMANVINPDLVVLSGGMANAGERLFGPIRDTVNERALGVAAEHIVIRPASLGENAGFVGAAGLALERHRGAKV